MSDQEAELMYLRWWYMQTNHAHGKSMEHSYKDQMGVEVPKRYQRNPSASYVGTVRGAKWIKKSERWLPDKK